MAHAVILEEKGSPPRSIRLERLVSTIGYGDECDVSLKPGSPALRLGMLIRSGDEFSFRPMVDSQDLLLDGKPVTGMTPFLPDSVLQVDSIYIRLGGTLAESTREESPSMPNSQPMPLAIPNQNMGRTAAVHAYSGQAIQSQEREQEKPRKSESEEEESWSAETTIRRSRPLAEEEAPAPRPSLTEPEPPPKEPERPSPDPRQRQEHLAQWHNRLMLLWEREGRPENIERLMDSEPPPAEMKSGKAMTWLMRGGPLAGLLMDDSWDEAELLPDGQVTLDGMASEPFSIVDDHHLRRLAEWMTGHRSVEGWLEHQLEPRICLQWMAKPFLSHGSCLRLIRSDLPKSLEHLGKLGRAPAQSVSMLEQALGARANICICGHPMAGKHYMLNTLIQGASGGGRTALCTSRSGPVEGLNLKVPDSWNDEAFWHRCSRLNLSHLGLNIETGTVPKGLLQALRQGRKGLIFSLVVESPDALLHEFTPEARPGLILEMGRRAGGPALLGMHAPVLDGDRLILKTLCNLDAPTEGHEEDVFIRRDPGTPRFQSH
jgi:hypothetical protein